MKRMAMTLIATVGWSFAFTLPQPLSAQTSESITISITPRDVYPPSPITDLQATPGSVGQMLLSWTAPDSNNFLVSNRIASSQYTIKIATFSIDMVGSTTTWWSAAQDVSSEPTPAAPGQSDFMLLNGLTPAVTYWAAIISEDTAGHVSNLDINAVTAGQQAFALIFQSAAPLTPTNLAAGIVTTSTVSLSWNSGGNPDGTLYRVERSLDGTNFSIVATTSSVTYFDVGLTANTQYFYRVVAVNGDGIPSSPSNTIPVLTLTAVDELAPDKPLGVRGFLDPTGEAFTFIWEQVTRNADGSPLDDLLGYNIYERTEVNGPAIKLNSWPLNTLVYAVRVAGKRLYYTIRAVDTQGNESEDSFYAESTALGNVIFLGPDELSTVTMPLSVNDILRSENNPYETPLTILMEDNSTPENSSEVLRQIRLFLARGDTKQEITDLNFSLPETTVSIGYNLSNGGVLPGAPGSGVTQSSLSPRNISLYWHNGVSWIKVGGELNEAKQSISIKTSFLGRYQIRAVALAPSFTLDQANVYPRLFTPNGDGLNDIMYFVVENPNDVSFTGKIFDIKGREVATLQQPTDTAIIGNTLIWDGRDSNGVVVPSGGYIYRIEGEGKVFTGTVAVAR